MDIVQSGVRELSGSEKLFKIKKINSRNEQRLAERAARVRGRDENCMKLCDMPYGRSHLGNRSVHCRLIFKHILNFNM